MIYKFRSRANGDLVMLGPQGDEMLKLLGRDPAAKGIIEVAAMPAAISALQAAADAEGADKGADKKAEKNAQDGDAQRGVGLRQRLWPMIEMLRRCLAADEPVVWGV